MTMKAAALILCLLSGFQTLGQGLPVYNHFYLNRFLYNPAFAASPGGITLSALSRVQWVNSSSSVSNSVLTAQVPAGEKVGLALIASNDQQGVLSSVSACMAFSYKVRLTGNQNLRFGLSAGGHKRSIDNEELDVTHYDDLSIATIENSSIEMIGSFGAAYENAGFTLGFSLPGLDLSSREGNGAKMFKNYLLSAGFKTKSQISLEPQLVFVSEAGVTNRLEGMVTCFFNDAVWAGGIYRIDYGHALYGGLNVGKSLKIGYAFETGEASVARSFNSTHEFLIAYKFKKR